MTDARAKQRDGRPPRAESNARWALWGRWIARAALAAAAALAVSLAWRPINSEDIGYHLAYGDAFLDTGRIVDSSDFIYTKIAPADLSGVGRCPPGAWFDTDAGRYRFPNANYASQIVMSLAYRAGGFTALCVLQAALVAAMVALLVLTMRRLSVPVLWQAGAVLLAAWVGYERYNLRPEMFGYVLLGVVLLLLVRGRMSWPMVAALVLTQWAFVQVHSYWLLAGALAGAFLAEAGLRAIWARFVTQRPLEADERRQLVRLAVAVGAMGVVVLINPWTWRLAAMPVQTLVFLRDNHITDALGRGQIHAWATIGEFFGPFAGKVLHTRATYAYVVVLALSALGGALACRRRRWAPAAILGGMILVSLGMRRNIAPTALVMLPVALGELVGLCAGGRLAEAMRRRAWPVTILAATVLALGAYWIGRVVTSRFYYDERRSWRFGCGHTPRDIPIALSRKLQALPRDVRVFTSYNVSSTVLYFSRGSAFYRDVPILTNTWAYPASVMADNLNLCAGQGDFARYARDHNVGIVVLDCSKYTAALASALMIDPNWTPLGFDGHTIILGRTNLELPDDFGDFRDVEQIIADIKARESLPAFALHRSAVALFFLGFRAQAERMWRECVREDPDYHEAWNQLGVVQAEMGGRENLLRAKECFERAVSIRGNYEQALKNLERVQADLARTSR